jgi:hypothetical protein
MLQSSQFDGVAFVREAKPEWTLSVVTPRGWEEVEPFPSGTRKDHWNAT